MPTRASVVVLTVAMMSLMGSRGLASPQPVTDLSHASPGDYLGGQVVVRFTEPLTPPEVQQRLAPTRYSLIEPLVAPLGIYLVGLPERMRVDEATVALRKRPWVRYAQPNHVLAQRATLPNDAWLYKQWHLDNQGEDSAAFTYQGSCEADCPGLVEEGACQCHETCVTEGDCCWNACQQCGACSGVIDLDIDAPEAWDYTTTSGDHGIAIVDVGFDMDHLDLVANIWANVHDSAGNGVDDDGNGYVDDHFGWHVATQSSDMVSNGLDHGTAVAGVAGAVGNNGIGISGVAWDTDMLLVDNGSSDGLQLTSTTAEAYGYILAMRKLYDESEGAKGLKVVVANSSFGLSGVHCDAPDYAVWNDLYNALGGVGILSAVATSNDPIDVDQVGDVPSTCSSPFVIAVTQASQSGLVDQTGYGTVSVDVAVPTENTWTTRKDHLYDTVTGTSIATPVVSGAIALLHEGASACFTTTAHDTPAAAALALKKTLLMAVDTTGLLDDKVASGGHLNLRQAIEMLKLESYCGDGCCGDGETATTCPGECVGTGACCLVHDTPGCDDLDVQAAVCSAEPTCCTQGWDIGCAQLAGGYVACEVCADLSCDDGDPCTTDTCHPQLGCVHTVVDCDDGDLCTVDECSLSDGCIHATVDCTVTDACVTTSCSPETGCEQIPVDCDDQSFCTTDACDPDEGCQHAAVVCDDGELCTVDTCDDTSGCQHAPLSCEDDDLCTTDSCDPLSGCVHAAVNCDDEDACTTDVCDALTGCVHAPVVCDDTDACAVVTCQPVSGCVAVALECDDGDLCTSDACDPGSGCVYTAVSCDDTDACTVDSCDPLTGCVFTSVPDCGRVSPDALLCDATGGVWGCVSPCDVADPACETGCLEDGCDCPEDTQWAAGQGCVPMTGAPDAGVSDPASDVVSEPDVTSDPSADVGEEEVRTASSEGCAGGSPAGPFSKWAFLGVWCVLFATRRRVVHCEGCRMRTP